MSYSQPIYVSDSENDFNEFESPGASDGPIDYSLNPYEEESMNPYEEESYNEEEENPTQRKLHKILHIIDKLRELFLEILDEI